MIKQPITSIVNMDRPFCTLWAMCLDEIVMWYVAGGWEVICSRNIQLKDPHDSKNVPTNVRKAYGCDWLALKDYYLVTMSADSVEPDTTRTNDQS